MNGPVEQGACPATDQAGDSLAGLLLRTAEGDHHAFSEFYRQTSTRVTGLVQRVVVDRALSEEVVQEVFITAWQDAGKYRPALGTPMAWLMTIAHRRAVDKVRSTQSSRTRDHRWAGSAPAACDGFVDDLADKMDAQIIIASLACLSALQRESILLAYFGSLTYQDIAAKLSVPLPTVKSRIRDGLQRLRSHVTMEHPGVSGTG